MIKYILVVLIFISGCVERQPRTLEQQLRECKRQDIIERHYNKRLYQHYRRIK